MKARHLILSLAVALATLGLGTSAMAKEPPIAKIVQVEGEVEYTRNGRTWSKVRRTKYLFDGYRIRTGSDGSGKLINQESGMAQKLGSASEVIVATAGIELVKGNLSEPQEETTSIFQSLLNKFARAQRYTTVRRSVTSGDEPVCNNKVRTIRAVTLSEEYPDLVWRNACPEFSYKLVINDETYDIPAQSTAEMIRFTVTDIEPGEHSYRVEVLDRDGTVYIPRSDSAFVWMDRKETKEMAKVLREVGDDIFVSTSLLEEAGLHVAAMDMYRDYFQENPDDNDMRPMLIQSYQELKLTNLRESEARLYNAGLEQDF